MNIKINDKSIYNSRMFSAGIWNVNDLYKCGKLIPFDVWLSRGATVADYLLWQALIDALPKEWKLMLKEDVMTSSNI